MAGSVIRIAGNAYGCPLSYEDVRQRVWEAQAMRSHVVELPIDWSLSGAEPRESLVGLNSIVWAKSNPETL